MPRVSLQRFVAYTAAVIIWLMMVALYLNQQSAWLGVRNTPFKSSTPGTEVTIPRAEKDVKDHKTNSDLSKNVSNTFKPRGMPWYMKKGGYKPLQTEKIFNIWPGKFNGDRIENQLMIPYAGSPDAPMKKIYLPNGLGVWWAKEGRAVFLDNQCPVDRCSLTDKGEDASSADAIMFKDAFHALSHKRSPNQIWIMYLLECPFHTQHFHDQKDVFNWSATYRSDSEIVAPYGTWVYYDKNIRKKPTTFNYGANKTKKVAWFVSNCNANNNRVDYAHKLQKFIQVDIYGACGTESCPRDSADRCFRILSEQYKFYLAFENSNCRDYITEKFYVNGLGYRVLPIVMGAPRVDYEKHAPEHSFIHVDDFSSPKELADYLNVLDQNDTLYNEYFDWRETGQFINTDLFWCRLCAMLHEAPKAPAHYYHDFEDWWRGNSTCIKGSWRDYFGNKTKQMK